MQSPYVSIIIPVRNGKDYLQDALDSALGQSFADFELLLIDDGSTDGDYDEYAQEDERIHVIHLEAAGVSHARNIGMAQARGDLFAFLDADDVWFPGKLQAQVNYFRQHRDVGVVFGKFGWWHASPSGTFALPDPSTHDVPQSIGADPARSGWLYTRLLNGLLVGMNTAVIRRTVYEEIGGFDEYMSQGEDYDFWLRASRVFEMHCLDGEVALYRQHDNNSAYKPSDDNYLANLLIAAVDRWGLQGPDGQTLSRELFNRRLAIIYFEHGYLHYWRGYRGIARASFLQALRIHYRPTRCLAYIVLSFLPFCVRVPFR
jgi:glycosyltransferase involved in cell wall biosynthesis